MMQAPETIRFEYPKVRIYLYMYIYIYILSILHLRFYIECNISPGRSKKQTRQHPRLLLAVPADLQQQQRIL